MLHHLNHLCSSLYEVSMLSADGSHEVINGGTTKLGKSTLSSGRSNKRRVLLPGRVDTLTADLRFCACCHFDFDYDLKTQGFSAAKVRHLASRRTDIDRLDSALKGMTPGDKKKCELAR